MYYNNNTSVSCRRIRVLPMKKCTSLVLLAFASSTLKNNVVSSQSLPTPNTQDQPNEPYTACPCFNKTLLTPITNHLLDDRIEILNGSCQFEDDELITSISILYQDRSTARPLPRDTDDIMTTTTGGMKERGGIGGGPMGMDVPPGSMKMYGVTAEIMPDSEGGFCNAHWPAEPQGPYPKNEIESCIMEIKDQCNKMKQVTCPCYNRKHIIDTLISLATAEDIIMDMERSCEKTSPGIELSSGVFGVFHQIFSTNNFLHNKMMDFHLNNMSVRYESDLLLGVDIEANLSHDKKCYGPDAEEITLNEKQWEHCTSLMDDLCTALEPKRLQTCPGCYEDDPDYGMNGNQQKTCKKITRNKRLAKKNCKKFDKVTENHVFQHCRRSCNSGSCNDRLDFHFNGQLDKGCDWIKENKSYCLLDEVANHCVNTCKSQCCHDDQNFKFNHDGEMRNCSYLRMHRFQKQLCRRNTLARKCPKTCLKCFVMPRNINREFNDP